MKRTITVVLEIDDMIEAKEIWELHVNHWRFFGGYIIAICEGDLTNDRTN